MYIIFPYLIILVIIMRFLPALLHIHCVFMKWLLPEIICTFPIVLFHFFIPLVFALCYFTRNLLHNPDIILLCFTWVCHWELRHIIVCSLILTSCTTNEIFEALCTQPCVSVHGYAVKCRSSACEVDELYYSRCILQVYFKQHISTENYCFFCSNRYTENRSRYCK